MKKAFLLVLCLAMYFLFFVYNQKEVKEQVNIVSDSDSMAQGDILSQKLDSFIPEIADAYGLNVSDFEKQEIKGGEYYYEARSTDKKILRLVYVDGHDANGKKGIYAVLYQIQNDETKPDFQDIHELKRYEIIKK